MMMTMVIPMIMTIIMIMMIMIMMITIITIMMIITIVIVLGAPVDSKTRLSQGSCHFAPGAAGAYPCLPKQTANLEFATRKQFR